MRWTTILIGCLLVAVEIALVVCDQELALLVWDVLLMQWEIY